MAGYLCSDVYCALCPRMCRAHRSPSAGAGWCGMGTDAVVARAALHHWEEPCISGTRGTGAVFFSGCTLRCVYCQNAPISQEGFGKQMKAQRLADVFRRLVDGDGAQSLSLITPTHFLPAILDALEIYRPPVPLVYNSAGYERVETVKAFEGVVDVWLPDLKYVSPRLSGLLSGAEGYFDAASKAVLQMCLQSGPPQYNEEGILTSGTLVRHLVLPGCTGDSIKVLQFISDSLPQHTPVSLMGQYTPQPFCTVPGMDRKLTKQEYRRVVSFMQALGLPGYLQGLDAAAGGYTPAFNLTGLE